MHTRAFTGVRRLFRIGRPGMPNTGSGMNATKWDAEMGRTSNYQANRAAIVTLVAQAQNRHSQPPTVRDLATELDIGVATVHSYLRRLAKEGLVEWTPNKHRSLRLTPQGFRLASSPEMRSA